MPPTAILVAEFKGKFMGEPVGHLLQVRRLGYGDVQRQTYDVLAARQPAAATGAATTEVTLTGLRPVKHVCRTQASTLTAYLVADDEDIDVERWTSDTGAKITRVTLPAIGQQFTLDGHISADQLRN